MKRIIPLIMLGGVLIHGCATYDDAPTRPVYDNSFPFNSLVTIGNSLTAGYQSGALFLDGQNAAFGNLIAQQLDLAQQLTHVDIAYPGIGSTDGFGRLELVFLEDGDSLLLIPQPYDNPLELLSNLDQTAPYSNLGVPGALLQESFMTTDSVTSLTHNPFFDFVLRQAWGQPAMTQIEAALAQNHDLVTFWMGNNDILGFAISGGVDPIGPFGGLDFTTAYGMALQPLADDVDYVVVANLPDVTTIPYCTYLGTTYAGMQLYGEVQGEVIALRAGEDYVLITAIDLLDTGLGFTPDAPLPDHAVLDATEAELVMATTMEYNATIAATVAALNEEGEGRTNPILLVDAWGYLTELARDGVMVAGTHLTTDFISGGLFSLDGVHPGYVGYALIANKFIETMNNGWSLAIPPVDVVDYLDQNQVFAPVAPEQLRIDPAYRQIMSDLF